MAAGWTDPRGASGGLEADYLERVADDLQLILGADIGIDAVEIVDVEPGTGADGRGAGEPGTEGARIALRARYHLGERTFETIGPGESLIDAHRRLRARLVIDRLRLAFSETVEPEHQRRTGAGRRPDRPAR